MEIIWSKNAVITFDEIVSQIDAKFGKNEALSFALKVDSISTLIKNQPYLFKQYSDFESIRKAVIHKNCSLFYEVNKVSIQLLYFWDNRQNPIEII